jgi:hypothetical protein
LLILHFVLLSVALQLHSQSACPATVVDMAPGESNRFPELQKKNEELFKEKGLWNTPFDPRFPNQNQTR